MAKEGGFQHGPIHTPDEFVPGGDSHKADSHCIYNGVPGYPKGTADKIDEVTFDVGGQFGKVKPVKE